MKILLTGATGFIGSHIADKLVIEGHQILSLKRSSSSLHNCENFKNKVLWCDYDDMDWIQKSIEWHPDAIIHSAWAGVDADDRNKWEIQFSNVDFVCSLLHVALKVGIRKFIGLGSQAEYGEFNSCINEEYPLNPVQKYGIVKVATLQAVKTFCQLNNIDWYWIRIFATFGERESSKWLIPSLMSKIESGERTMELTKCEQKYAYLYVGDLANAFFSVLNTDGKSGIYNLSSKRALPLNYIVTYIRDKINPEFQLNFGKLPYRQGQAMHIQAETNKFVQAFGAYETETFESVINNICANLDSCSK